MRFNWIIHSRTTLDTGVVLGGSPVHIVTPEYYWAKKGTVLSMLQSEYVFNIATYRVARDESFIHEFKYLPDSAYFIYNKDLDIERYSAKDYVFDKDTYFRICVKRKDSREIQVKEFKNFNELEKVRGCEKNNNFDNLDICPSSKYYIKIAPMFGIKGEIYEPLEMQKKLFVHNPIFDDECKRVVDLIRQNHSEDCLKLVLASDSHFALNGTYEQSAYNMRNMFSAIKADAMIHLGDFTDGLLSKKLAVKYTKYVLELLPKPLYICLGNHDANYYMHNPDFTMDIIEQSREYLGRDKPYYYIDIKGIRFIFLDCYDDNRKYRYGYTDEELIWFDNLLKNTHQSIIVFGHCPPFAELDYWAKKTHNGDWLIEILQEYNERGNVLAYINGHVHSENVNYSKGFPIITIGCNKCEDFKNYKPGINITYDRKIGDITQELFYVLVLDDDAQENLHNDVFGDLRHNLSKRNINKRIYLYRFGAGEDKVVEII